ncbi:hypothetical protein [Desulfovibrio aminophilus]|uniref:hypothetical protein n=1 Tax=Desulfovibrio aminophilus TaxID=81425 RepID=UPI00339294E6
MTLSNADLCQEVSKTLAEQTRGWIFLSSLGLRLRQSGYTWEGKLVSILERCDQIALIKDPLVKERILVCPIENKEKCEAQIGSKDAHRELAALPRALVLAFTIQVQQGQHVFVTLGDSVRYEIAQSASSDQQIMISDEYRDTSLPAYKLTELNSDQAKSLLNSITRWAKSNSINLEDLNWKSRSLQKQSAPGQNALSRLLLAIPRDLRSQINIPADIAELLLKHL